MVLDPTIPTAPEDVEPYVLRVDRDGSGQLQEAIAYPNGDRLDFVWIQVLNLHDQPPANFREFRVALTCDGTGAERLRWGVPGQATLTCGESMVMPFLAGANQQAVAILLPDGSEQSYVRYGLTAVAVVG